VKHILEKDQQDSNNNNNNNNNIYSTAIGLEPGGRGPLLLDNLFNFNNPRHTIDIHQHMHFTFNNMLV